MTNDMTDSEHAKALEIANRVLASFFDGRIEKRKSGMYVCWSSRQGDMAMRWQCRNQDFYPVWNRKYPGGGTSSTALSQLIRWVQGKPVLPISTWRMWSSEPCKLLPVSAVDHLLAGGYPEHVECVLCGVQISGHLDWWSLNGTSGPCCGWTTGCRQRIGEVNK